MRQGQKAASVFSSRGKKRGCAVCGCHAIRTVPALLLAQERAFVSHLYILEIMSLGQIRTYIKPQAPQQKLPVKVEQLPQDIAIPASALYVALFIWTTAQVRPPPGGADWDGVVLFSSKRSEAKQQQACLHR